SAFVPPLAIYLYRCRGKLQALGYLYPIVWFAAVFVFYSISQSKRAVYILPVYPALSLLLGAWWHELAPGRIAAPKAMSRALVVAGAAMVAAVALAATILATTIAGAKPMMAFAPLLKSKDLTNLPLVQELVESHLPILVLWVLALIPVSAVFLRSA